MFRILTVVMFVIPAHVSFADSNTVNNSANTGQASQSSGALVNGLASAALYSSCMASNPPNLMLCAMGALAALQAANQSSSAGQSSNSAGASAADTSTTAASSAGTSSSSAIDSVGTAGFSSAESATVAAGNSALKEAGYTVSESGVTTSSGTTLPASSFDSSRSMASAGIDSATIREAERALASASNGAKVTAMAVDSSGGGSRREPASAPEFGGEETRLGPTKARINVQSFLVGKTLNASGERIGVKSQNIFELVSNVYQRKLRNGELIKDP